MLVVPEGGSTLAHNLTQMIDGHTGVEHALPVAAVYQDVLQLWSKSTAGYTPTLGVAYGGLFGENAWYERMDVWADERLSKFVPQRLLDARSRRRTKVPPEELNHIKAAQVAAALNERGVSVQLGAHGQREGLAAHWELWMLVEGGMSPADALRAGTLNGARYLGLDADVGSTELGKVADVIVLDSNPLENIRNSRSVRYTIQAGRVLDASTLDEVWPTVKKHTPFFFQNDGQATWGTVTHTAAED